MLAPKQIIIFYLLVCRLDYPIYGKLEEYLTAEGHSEKSRKTSLERWGKNIIKVEMPSMRKLLFLSLTKPHFLGGLARELLMVVVFTNFSKGPVPLYFYVDSFVTIVEYILLQVHSAVQWRAGFIENDLKLNSQGEFKTLCKDSLELKGVGTENIVPEDILALHPDEDCDRELPCDALLLSGSIWTSEAVLTGEDKEIHKTGIDKGEGEQPLNLERDSVHSTNNLLRGGCKITRIEPSGKPNKYYKPSIPCLLLSISFERIFSCRLACG